MRYELFLRRDTELEQPEELLAEASAAELRAELYVHPHSGEARGLDLGVDLEAPAGTARLCKAAFELAAAHGLQVFDPQLGRTVCAADQPAIEERFEQSSAFAVAAPVTPGADSPGLLSPSAKLWLLVIGVVVLLFLLLRGASCLV